MARQDRRKKTTEEDPIPVVEPQHDERGRGRNPQAATRAPKGPGFALKIGLAAGVAAGFLAALAVLVMARVGGSDATAVLDLGGVQAARMLAATDTGRWAADFGTSRGTRAHIKEQIEAQLEKIKAESDSRVVDLLKEPVQQFWTGVPGSDASWRPGLDMFLPKNDPDDLQIDKARREGFARVQSQGRGALLGMAIIDGAKRTIFSEGNPVGGATDVGTVGATRISAAQGVRVYEHPVYDRNGNPDGVALVALDTSAAVGPDVMGTAGAAGGLAFLGAFLFGTLLGLGPVKAIQRLAAETDVLARGELGGRVTLRGPDSVVAVARGVQKLASLAARPDVEPQVVAQPMPVIPVAEIHEVLAPSRTFQRPENIEIESTHKACPDSGNDYHDVINLPGGKIGLFVADAPLRGVRGAMYMAAVRSLFRAEAPKSESPAEVLRGINRGFAADLPRGVYVTAMYCILDPATGVCTFAGAQHLPLVFWKLEKKGSARVQTQGIALGHDSGPMFDKTIEEKSIQLERGDRIVLFTDGAITARNATGAAYGEERFYYVVNREAPKNSAAFVNFVANDVDLFHEGSPQLDDFTILTARRLR